MNMEYLNSLPKAENKFNVELEEGEYVIFAENMNTFGNEKDRMLGNNCNFTFTNRRMLIDNHAGVFTINVEEDIAGWKKVKGGFLFMKWVYFAIDLLHEVVFDYGSQTLTGYHFYFDEEKTVRFEEIMNNLFS